MAADLYFDPVNIPNAEKLEFGAIMEGTQLNNLLANLLKTEDPGKVEAMEADAKKVISGIDSAAARHSGSRKRKLAETSIYVRNALDTALMRRQSMVQGMKFRRDFRELVVKSSKVDICFLVDCTSSMGHIIPEVKDRIDEILSSCEDSFEHFEARLAVVGYRDWSEEASGKKYEILQFTNNLNEFKTFVADLKPMGGGDTAEDVLGGMGKMANELEWRNDVKLVLHFLDAPPHGQQFHDLDSDDDKCCKKSYPKLGDIFGKMALADWKNADMGPAHYFMVDCKRKTQKSILTKTFEAFRAQYRKTNEDMCFDPNYWQFETMEIQDPLRLTQIAIDSITSSLVSTNSRTISTSRKRRKLNVEVDKTVYDNISWHNIPGSIADGYMYEVKEGLTPIISKTGDVGYKKHKTPFAQGSERIATHCQQWSDETPNDIRHVVHKQLKKKIPGALSICCEVSAIMMKFVKMYQQAILAAGITDMKVVGVPVYLFKEQKTDEQFTMEPFVEGQFIKVNNNRGVVVGPSKLTDFLQAFCYFTYKKSGLKILICDIQGWVKKNSVCTHFIITDPAIHCRVKPGTYGATDHGSQGINAFLKTYDMNNKYHKALGLGDVLATCIDLDVEKDEGKDEDAAPK